jgi:CheY-like chemotaxis protein
VLDDAHRVVVAQDGSDAIALLQSGTLPDAVILELSLPERDGREVLSWLEADQPWVHKRTLVVTSAASSQTYTEFLKDYAGAVLHKPVRGSELLSALDKLIEDDAGD